MVDNTMLLVVNVVGDTGKYKLKINENGNSDVWKKFPLISLKMEMRRSGILFCACHKCFKMYQYKDSCGRPFGTRNLLEHVKRCVGDAKHSQLRLQQCISRKVQLSKPDKATL